MSDSVKFTSLISAFLIAMTASAACQALPAMLSETPPAVVSTARADVILAASDDVVLQPAVIQVGKWAEGVAFDGTSMWVAESGQRTIAKIDRNGRVIDRAKVGRLPVAMVSNGDGIVYSLVHTDQLVWRQPNNGRGGAFARLGTCPEAMTISARHLWVVTLPSCSSQSSQLVRIDLNSGRQARSQVLGEWGQAVTTYGNRVWIAHARGPAITVVDQNSLGAWTLNVPGASLWSITTNAANVYAGGRVDENNQDGVVVMMDPDGQRELFRAHFSERIAEIAADDSHVVAVGENGTMWVLSARDLQLQRTIRLSTGGFKPRAAMLLDGVLVLTSGTFSGENGAVLALKDWRPQNAGRPVTPVTPVADCAQIQNTTDRTVCDSRTLSAMDEEMNAELVLAIINTTSEAAGGTLDDAVALHKEQRTWLHKRDRCGADVACLTTEYRARLKYMKELNQPE